MRRNFEILSSNQAEPIRLRLGNSVIIGVHAPQNQSGCLIRIEYSEFNSTTAAAAIQEAIRICRDKNQLELKFVCRANGSKHVCHELQKIGHSAAAFLERQNPIVEVLYFPKAGRLRVERDPAIAPAARTSVSMSSSPSKTRILVVDDSLTMQKLLTSIFERESSFEVAGVAERPSQVEELIKKLRPDIITLDIHMPEMDGVSLLKRIYPKYLIPTVMITSASRDEGPLVLNALEAGAVDYIQKPTLDKLGEEMPQMIEKLKIAANTRGRLSNPVRLEHSSRKRQNLDPTRIIAIGSSTGGTEALKDLFTALPKNIPPIVVVQHIPPIFSAALAKRLADLCPFEVKEAEDGDLVQPGRVLIAPGGNQMQVVKNGGAGNLRVQIRPDPPVNRHQPSVDVLFESIAKQGSSSSIGVLLTGMGTDGAKGLLEMKNTGCHTIAQDEATCVVFGMPREAIRINAATEVLPLYKISDRLVNLLATKDIVDKTARYNQSQM